MFYPWPSKIKKDEQLEGIIKIQNYLFTLLISSLFACIFNNTENIWQQDHIYLRRTQPKIKLILLNDLLINNII